MSDYIKSLFNLKSRVAVLTGSGGHLCSEMARGLAKSGCNIVVVDIRKEKANKVAQEIKKIGIEVMALQADASNKEEMYSCLNEILSEFKKIDILINGAGINFTPFLDITLMP